MLTLLHEDFIVTKLIIFDSDGVLVDSEKIALTVLAGAASEEGAASIAQRFNAI
jgi:beta-phosphoglucomutase-like phosphatase (HAD superfamily)